MEHRHIYHYTGKCPYIGKNQTIIVTFFSFDEFDGYKKDRYSCPLKSQCPYVEQDKYHRCPVYLECPASPY